MDMELLVGTVAGVMAVAGGVVGAVVQRTFAKKTPTPPAQPPPPAARKKFASKSGSPFDPVA